MVAAIVGYASVQVLQITLKNSLQPKKRSFCVDRSSFRSAIVFSTSPGDVISTEKCSPVRVRNSIIYFIYGFIVSHSNRVLLATMYKKCQQKKSTPSSTLPLSFTLLPTHQEIQWVRPAPWQQPSTLFFCPIPQPYNNTWTS